MIQFHEFGLVYSFNELFIYFYKLIFDFLMVMLKDRWKRYYYHYYFYLLYLKFEFIIYNAFYTISESMNLKSSILFLLMY